MKKHGIDWAIKILILSIALSVVFSMISQGIYPILPTYLSIFVILFFIFVSSIFDMIGVAFTSFDINKLEKHKNDAEYQTALKLCKNAGKVSSFCADVVGDICGILCGAGGVSIVVNLNIQNSNIYLFLTCIISSLIAGLTVFAKAIMKPVAIEKSESIVLRTARVLNSPVLSFLKKRK